MTFNFFPMSRNINNFSYFSHQLKNHLSIDQFIMSNLVNMQSFIRTRCKHAKLPIFTKKCLPGGTGVDFLVKFGTPALRSHILTSWRILIKLRIITKLGMINRTLGLTLFGKKNRKTVTSVKSLACERRRISDFDLVIKRSIANAVGKICTFCSYLLFDGRT